MYLTPLHIFQLNKIKAKMAHEEFGILVDFNNSLECFAKLIYFKLSVVFKFYAIPNEVIDWRP